MFKLRNLGLLLACLITALAVFGAATLIALDFVGTDGLARAWLGISSWWSEPAPAGRPARVVRIG